MVVAFQHTEYHPGLRQTRARLQWKYTAAGCEQGLHYNQSSENWMLANAMRYQGGSCILSAAINSVRCISGQKRVPWSNAYIRLFMPSFANIRSFS